MSALACNESIPPIPELVARTGVTYRQLDYWIRLGYLHPIRRRSYAGTGSPREWPDAEIKVAERMAALVLAGLTLAAAHHAARHDGFLPDGRHRVTA